MASKGLHFIGDSAYSIKLFILTPYDNAVRGTSEDNYNFFHSSSRIAVECCFGEVDLRFGIFWWPLKFSLKTNGHVIDACLWQHNFMGPRGAGNRYIFNRRPTERCCGQIWHGVVKQENTYSYVISTGTRKLELPTL